MSKAKTTYRVTDKGGPRPDIAGQRRKVGEEIKLTESEARFELSRGMIEPVGVAVEDAPTEASAPAATASRKRRED